jgi:hypothetical protein
MMKKLIFSLFIICLTIPVFGQNKKNKAYLYKEGTFYSVFTNDIGDQDTLIVKRENNIQTESIIENKVPREVVKVKVIWLNDSKYILRNVNHVNQSKKFIKDDILCKVIETGDDYYIVKAKLYKEKPLKIKLYRYTTSK